MLRRGGEKEKFQNEEVRGHLDSYNQLFRVLRIPCVKKKKNAYTFHPLATTRTKRTQRHSACADLYHTFCLNSAGSVNLPRRRSKPYMSKRESKRFCRNF